jgi:hypothetical protein
MRSAYASLTVAYLLGIDALILLFLAPIYFMLTFLVGWFANGWDPTYLEKMAVALLSSALLAYDIFRNSSLEPNPWWAHVRAFTTALAIIGGSATLALALSEAASGLFDLPYAG